MENYSQKELDAALQLISSTISKCSRTLSMLGAKRRGKKKPRVMPGKSAYRSLLSG